MTDTSPRPVRVRIAPSPTGDPHIGTAYIGLFNVLFAQKHGGKFIVRIEDTDRSRYRETSENEILDSLKWLGLSWDEGPDTPEAPYGPYRQSERLPIYREHADMLISKGKAYPCFCTSERLAELRKEQASRKENPGYDGLCRGISPEEAQKRCDAGEAHTVRLKVEKSEKTQVQDLLRGEIEFENNLVDDQVLLKTDGFPTYHLAVVVDDHLMKISHVIRGEEWITSTPKHVMLYKAFGWELPTFIHLPLLRNPDGGKISKRKNPTNILFYKRRGFLPEALVNYMALLGYHPPGEEEKFRISEIAETFDAKKIHLGGPIFDVQKLEWLNGQYLRELTDADYLNALTSGLLSSDSLKKIVPLMKERITCFDEFVSHTGFFFSGEINYENVDFVPKKSTPKDVRNVFQLLLTKLDLLDDWSVDSVTSCFEAFLEENELKAKQVYMPVRMAVTGRRDSPPLFETIEVLGKEIVKFRIRKAEQHLKTVAN